MSQPASAPAPAPAPAKKAASASNGAAPPWGTPPAESVQSVGNFAAGGSGTNSKASHPAQSYGGVGSPAGDRTYCLAIAKHEMAGAAGVREQDALLRREIRRSNVITAAQKAMAQWKLRRANRRLAGALEAAARAAAHRAKVRAEVNHAILSGKRKRPRPQGFTVQ